MSIKKINAHTAYTPNDGLTSSGSLLNTCIISRVISRYTVVQIYNTPVVMTRMPGIQRRKRCMTLKVIKVGHTQRSANSASILERNMGFPCINSSGSVIYQANIGAVKDESGYSSLEENRINAAEIRNEN